MILLPNLDDVISTAGINGAGKSTILQAICFAAAAPLNVLGVSKINELRHNYSKELCEVKLLLRPCTTSNKASKKKYKDGNEEIHVHAVINAEGNRVFRLNNRIVSGKEIKNKLGKLGVHLGTSTSLILQSAVTELADSTDPLSLGVVIAECSGLQVWAKEAAHAHSELEAQAKDEQRIRQKIETLKLTSAAARNEASKGEKYAQLEAQVEAAAETCAAKIAGVRAAAEEQREFISEMHTTALEKENQFQKQLAQLEEQKKSTAYVDDVDLSPSLEAKKLKLARVSIEEELQVVSDQLTTYEGIAAALKEAKIKENNAVQRYELSLREIESLEQGLLEIEMQSSSLEAAAKAQQEVDALKVQLAEAKHEVTAAEEALQQAQHHLNKLAAEMEQTKENLRLHKHSIVTENGDVNFQLAKLASTRTELQRKERALVARQKEKSPNEFKLLMLDQCFKFKDPAKAASQIAAALEVLAGRRLNIAIAQSTQQAAQVLASKNAPRGLRIWALDAISPGTDRIKFHRQVAATFQPAGSVIVPLDLLSFDASLYEGVIAKAFGSHVIVSTVQIGRQVMEQYGIPSIALDGTITSRGQLVGGYRASEQQLRGHMHTKLRSDLENASLREVLHQLGELDAAELKLKAQAKAKAAEAAAEEAILKFKEAQGQFESAQKSFAKASNAVQCIEMELKSRQTVAAALYQACSHSGAESLAAGDPTALLRTKIAQQRNMLEYLEHQKAAAAAEVATATSACPPGGELMPDDRTELQEARAQLEERLNEIDYQLLLLKEQFIEKQKQHSAAHSEEEAFRQREVEAATTALNSVAVEKATLGKQLNYFESILKEMKTIAAETGIPPNEHHQHTKSTSSLDFSIIQSMLEEVRVAAEQHASLLAELATYKSLDTTRSSVDAMANYRAAEIAESELSVLISQADIMHKIANNLAQGIQLMNPYAEKYNECAFDTVAALFKELTAQLLSGIELRVTRVNSTADDQSASIHRNGAQFSYRRHGTQEENWIIGLEALSGGQRTLISLSYLVAAKSVGGAALSFSSSVLLADEVDAALDIGNQEQAARLLSMLCTKKDRHISAKPPLAQVICISHSHIFQQLCDKVIKLTRSSKNGTTMLAPTTSP